MALLAALMLPPAGPALGKDLAAKIQDLIDKATVEFKDGDYAVALIHYEDALRASGDQRLLFMIGRCLEETGRIPEAIDAYERFLIEDAPSKARARALERVRALRESRQEGRVRVVAAPEATEIRVDGKVVGAGPGATLDVVAGEHLVEVVVPGRPVASMKVDVPVAGEVVADLTPQGGPSVGATTVTAGADAGGEIDGLAWGLLGSGASLTVGGAVLVGLGMSDLEAVDGAEVVDGVTQVTRQRAMDLRDRGDALVTSGWTLVGVGGAALVTSVVLLVVDASSDGPAVSATPIPGGGSFLVTGSF